MLISKFDDRHLLATERLVGDTFMLLGALPGFSAWEKRSLRFRPTAANIEYIQAHWPDAEWDSYSASLRDTLATKRESAKDTGALKKLDAASFKTNFKFKTVPYDHQVKAFILSRDAAVFALFMEQGTGKTKVILDTAAYLAQIGEIEALIIVAPNGVHENWTLNEAPKHMPDWMEYESWVFSGNSEAKYRRADLKRVLESEALKIITINIESVASRKIKGVIKPSKSAIILERCLNDMKCMVVIDESGRIRNSTSKRSRYLKNACRQAPYKRILTGTPITNGMENLYGQIVWLDQDIIGYDTLTSFKARYCIIKPLNFGEMIVGYKNQEELIERIDGFSFRVLKEDCLDLPPKIYKSHPVYLSPEQGRMYNDLLEDWETSFEEETLTADLAITRLLRLQQIICGWFKADDGELMPITGGDGRIKALKTILQDVEGKVIIWARFVVDLDTIEQALFDKGVIRYKGNVVDANRFQEDPSIKYFIANPASAGLGLTLTEAETVIYYSNDFDLEHRQQSEDRNHRIGTKGAVTYIDLIAKGTVDQKIVSALRNKKLVSDAVLQDPESFFLEYAE